jgi:hydrogenase maturation protease
MYRLFFLPAAIMHASLVAAPRNATAGMLTERPIDLTTAETQGTTLVLGLGNVIMGDEGVGVHVVRAIEKHPLPANVECLDGGTGGFTLLEPLQSAARVILIDAANDGNPLGTVTRTTPRFSRDYPPTLTAHDIGVKDLLDVFYIQGGGPEVILYAITIDPKQPISMELSEGAVRAAEVAVAKILVELEHNSTAWLLSPRI